MAPEIATNARGATSNTRRHLDARKAANLDVDGSEGTLSDPRSAQSFG